MRTVFFLIISFLALFKSVRSQGEEILATINNRVITSSEFTRRFELSPTLTQGSEEAAKYDFLNTLVAEKLWSTAALELNLDTAHTYKLSLEYITKIYANDYLFKKEISDKVFISDSAFRTANYRAKNCLHVRFLYSENKSEIDSLSERLNSGVAFDSLLIGREEFSEQPEPVEVIFGQMNENEENILFSMNVKQNSPPIKAGNGWIIYHLVNITPYTETKNLSEKKIREIINLRERKKIGDEYLSVIFKDKTGRANRETLEILVDKLREKSDLITPLKNQSGKIENRFLPENIFSFYNSLSQKELHQTIITIKGENYGVDEFLTWLMNEEVKLQSPSHPDTFNMFNKKLDSFFRFTVIANEAQKMECDKAPEVLEEVDKWRDNYLSAYYRNFLSRSVKVSDEEIEAALQDHLVDEKLTPRIKLLEIHERELESISNILSRLSEGESFEELYKELNNSGNQPELKYFYEYGKPGSIALKKKTGDIFGPLTVENGYSLFKLIEKEETKDSSGLGVTQIESGARQKLYYEKLEKELTDKTIELAEKYQVEINHDKLTDIHVNSMNMIVYRKMGFGGKLLATPFLETFSDWYNQWRESQRKVIY